MDDTSRKNVLIIYTGGTLGMRPSAKGYVPADDLGRLIRERLPELGMRAMPGYEIVEHDYPLDSANAAPHHWYELARQIRVADARFDGFVMIHGTDTLAYTASALSFLLADFGKPVLLTGSQIPLCEVRNDAAGNLIGAMQAIATGRVNEVAICFGRYILRGNRTTKVNATELDAFISPNVSPLAEIGTHFRFNSAPPLPPDSDLLGGAMPGYRDCNIAVLRIYPGIHGSFIDAIAGTDAAGIIMRCYGTGTAPVDNPEFLAALTRASHAGVVIVAVSQCLEGSVSLGRYAAGSALADAGVVSGADMTTEAALTKLHTLFSRGLSRTRIAGLMPQNLRGELTPE